MTVTLTIQCTVAVHVRLHHGFTVNPTSAFLHDMHEHYTSSHLHVHDHPFQICLFSGRFLGLWQGCGDRSVFVTSHRPAHLSRAHVISLIELCISHLKCFLFAHLPPRAPPCLWFWSLPKFWMNSLFLKHSGRYQNPQHRVWLGGSNSWMCLPHFLTQQVSSWPRSKLLAKTMMLKVLFMRNLFNSATCVKLSLFVSVLPILFILRWQLGSPCLPMQGYALKIPSG